MTATLSCDALRDDIIALLYDDGDAVCKSRARDHLAQCVPCRAEYSELKGVRKALQGWELPLPAPLPQTRATGRWFATGLAAAAGLVLGIGVALAGRTGQFVRLQPGVMVYPLEADRLAVLLGPDSRLDDFAARLQPHMPPPLRLPSPTPAVWFTWLTAPLGLPSFASPSAE